jgi:hypothetical protein
VVPGLHKWLWEKRIHEFEHDPRLLASITGGTAEGLAATRQRWVATALERLDGPGIGSPQQRFAPPRWIAEQHRRRDVWRAATQVRNHCCAALGIGRTMSSAT